MADLDQKPEEVSDIDSEEEMFLAKGGDYHQQLLKACQKGDFELVKKCISKNANIFVEDKKKWTPIVWAACKGHTDIVRFLLQHGAADPYLSGDQLRHVVQGTINQNLKPTPLQWACFKGHRQIVNLLLKHGLKWDDIDQFGNDCCHLAAASGNFEVFQDLVSFGVSFDRLNTSCLDLSTNPKITQLIHLHNAAKTCHISGQVPRTKHWCRYRKIFVSENCRNKSWAYEHKDSLEPEMLDIRCNNCYAEKEKKEIELQSVIDEYSYEAISQKINEIDSLELVIDVKLKDHALIVQERLRNQLNIRNFIKNLEVIENYKTILKSHKILQDMKNSAEKNNVVLDQDVLDLIKQQQGRLVAERNLRFELDNIATNNATQDQVDRLCQLMELAKENQVSQNYIDDAEVLRSKMFKGIQSGILFKKFKEYPTRWIPEPIIYDPKTKKPLDPVTKKPIDPKNLPKPPKPRRGEPKFQFPDWADTTDKHQQNITEFEELLTEAQELNLTEEFVTEAKTQIARLKNDLRYRYQLEKEAKELAEQKAAEKAKNKKK